MQTNILNYEEVKDCCNDSFIVEEITLSLILNKEGFVYPISQHALNCRKETKLSFIDKIRYLFGKSISIRHFTEIRNTDKDVVGSWNNYIELI